MPFDLQSAIQGVAGAPPQAAGPPPGVAQGLRGGPPQGSAPPQQQIQIIRKIQATVRQAVGAFDDEQDIAIMEKITTDLQGMLVRRQKETDAQMGSGPAAQGLRRSNFGPNQ